MDRSVTGRNCRWGHSAHLMRGFSQMPAFHSLAQAGAYPVLPDLPSQRRAYTSGRPRNRRRNRVTFSSIESRDGAAATAGGAAAGASRQTMPLPSSSPTSRAFSARRRLISSLSALRSMARAMRFMSASRVIQSLLIRAPSSAPVWTGLDAARCPLGYLHNGRRGGHAASSVASWPCPPALRMSLPERGHTGDRCLRSRCPCRHRQRRTAPPPMHR